MPARTAEPEPRISPNHPTTERARKQDIPSEGANQPGELQLLRTVPSYKFAD
jgi:hypothetical protein